MFARPVGRHEAGSAVPGGDEATKPTDRHLVLVKAERAQRRRVGQPGCTAAVRRHVCAKESSAHNWQTDAAALFVGAAVGQPRAGQPAARRIASDAAGNHRSSTVSYELLTVPPHAPIITSAPSGHTPVQHSTFLWSGNTGFTAFEFIQSSGSDLLVMPSQFLSPDQPVFAPVLDWIIQVIPTNLWVIREIV